MCQHRQAPSWVPRTPTSSECAARRDAGRWARAAKQLREAGGASACIPVRLPLHASPKALELAWVMHSDASNSQLGVCWCSCAMCQLSSRSRTAPRLCARQHNLHSSTPTLATQTNNHQRYYKCMTSVETRFPISNEKGNVKLTFPWTGEGVWVAELVGVKGCLCPEPPPPRHTLALLLCRPYPPRSSSLPRQIYH